MARVFARHGLRLDVPISTCRVGANCHFPYIKVESWIQTLDRLGKLHKLVGLGTDHQPFSEIEGSLLEFWNRFRLMHGQHQVFAEASRGSIQLNRAFPVYMHGDEGTTYKKDGCLCLSFHSPLGRGTSLNKMGPVEDGLQGEQHVNFVGHAFETRFLLGAMLKAL